MLKTTEVKKRSQGNQRLMNSNLKLADVTSANLIILFSIIATNKIP